MLGKEKFYNNSLNKKLNNFFLNLFFFIAFISNAQASIQEQIISKLQETKTLTFDFIQKIDNIEEIGNCFIKYPLLMKCNYEDLKKKTIISNGKTIAIVKKKYKKIYYYPIKSTPLFTILKKEKIINLIKNNLPTKINTNTIEYEFIMKNSEILKIFFDKNTLTFKGWETKDSYSNTVNFLIINLELNREIKNNFFKIPREEDL